MGFISPSLPTCLYNEGAPFLEQQLLQRVFRTTLRLRVEPSASSGELGHKHGLGRSNHTSELKPIGVFIFLSL